MNSRRSFLKRLAAAIPFAPVAVQAAVLDKPVNIYVKPAPYLDYSGTRFQIICIGAGGSGGSAKP